MNDEFYMRLAIDEAWKYQGVTYPNPAVGCVVLDSNSKLLSINAHKKAGEPHAEVLALKEAYLKNGGNKELANITDAQSIHNFLYKNHNNILKDSTVYVTLEPCNHHGKTPPCSLLLSKLNIKRVVIAHNDLNEKASGGIEFLKQNSISVTTDVLNKEAHNLLEPFLHWQKSNFVLFKWAQRLNGSLDGGTISSNSSRILSHKIRSVCDLLVIGGNTVRVDSPTLDARLCNAKAPNVLIYSKEKNFDVTIPLFNVKNREVIIKDNFNELKNRKFVFVEGSPTLLDKMSEEINWLMVFISPKMQNGKSMQTLNKNYEIIHQQKIDSDILIWMRKSSE